VTQSCAPPVAVVVEAIFVDPSLARADLYALLQSAVRTLSMDARHMMATSRCFGRCWQRTVSPHHRQAGTSNLLMHDDARATKAVESI
jgi:hypothetical protein